MSMQLISVTLPKCGTCSFAQSFKSGMADCFGVPPTVHIIGMSPPDVLGRPGLQIEAFVPRVREDRPGCSLWKKKDDFRTMGEG